MSPWLLQFLLLPLPLTNYLALSRDSSVGIATGYRLIDWMIGVRFRTGAGNFSLIHRYVQTGCGARSASCPVGTGGSFSGVKRAEHEADSSPPSIADVKKCVELYLHSSNISSWHGAYFSTGTTLPSLILCYTQSMNIVLCAWRIVSLTCDTRRFAKEAVVALVLLYCVNVLESLSLHSTNCMCSACRR
jgi:hypothetical protein